MDDINVTSAQYVKDEKGNNFAILATINGFPTSVPLDPANRHYAEIMRQVEEGKLTIAPADEE